VKPRFFASAADWRAWLAANHGDAGELLVGFWKTATKKPCMTWSESVDEALCFGWIDGVRKGLGDASYSIRFTPRKPNSIWSSINVAKVEALRASGKMMPAGEAAFGHRTAARTGVYSFERAEAAVLPPAMAKRLRANAAASAWFDAQPPGYRKTATHWVISAKQEETRERRLETLIEDSTNGLRIKPLRVLKK
jgi:uncharacterized protein YdeI (YjbR/CyaY-like superfamily)